MKLLQEKLGMTDKEAEVLEDRLQLWDCLAEVLGDKYNKYDVEQCAFQLQNDEIDLDNLGSKEKMVFAILEDCIKGGTWATGSPTPRILALCRKVADKVAAFTGAHQLDYANAERNWTHWEFKKKWKKEIRIPKENDVWVFNDGGREKAGFKGYTGDCVTRAIAIVSGLPYREIYDELFKRAREYGEARRCRVARQIQKNKGKASPRTGMWKEIYKPYLAELGFKWTPTMGVGTGCTVHLKKDELPDGKLIVKVSRHLTAVIDGKINDTHDCSRDGQRCVYGYWTR